MIDHLSITTTDLDRAQAFYDAALGALGYPRVHRRAEAMGYGVRDHGPDAPPYISIYLCTDRLVPDNRHWCFRAKSRAAVRAFHEAALANGGIDNRTAGHPGKIRSRLLRRFRARSRWQPDRSRHAPTRGWP